MKIGDVFTLTDGVSVAEIVEISDDGYFCWARVTSATQKRRLLPFRCSDGISLAHESYGSMPGLSLSTVQDLEF